MTTKYDDTIKTCEMVKTALREEFGVSRRTLTRYLAGQYGPAYYKYELQQQIRKRALQLNAERRIDDDVIYVRDNARTDLAKEFGLHPDTITKFLRGYFRPENKRIKLIKAVRDRARKMVDGKTLFVARDETGELNAFRYEPRKEDGFWLNPLDTKGKYPFREELLPDGVNPQYEDKLPVRLLIIRKRNKSTV